MCLTRSAGKPGFSVLFPSQWSWVLLVSGEMSPAPSKYLTRALPVFLAAGDGMGSATRSAWGVPSWLGPGRARTRPGKHRHQTQAGSACAPCSTRRHAHACPLTHTSALRHKPPRPPTHRLSRAQHSRPLTPARPPPPRAQATQVGALPHTPRHARSHTQGLTHAGSHTRSHRHTPLSPRTRGAPPHTPSGWEGRGPPPGGQAGRQAGTDGRTDGRGSAARAPAGAQPFAPGGGAGARAPSPRRPRARARRGGRGRGRRSASACYSHAGGARRGGRRAAGPAGHGGGAGGGSGGSSSGSALPPPTASSRARVRRWG